MFSELNVSDLSVSADMSTFFIFSVSLSDVCFRGTLISDLDQELTQYNYSFENSNQKIFICHGLHVNDNHDDGYLAFISVLR